MTETLSPALPDEIEAAVHDVLQAAHDAELMLATAESCTGGLIASLLTDVEGVSHVFERGFVVYSEHAKCELLGLVQDDIDRCGVVSKDVAIAMAKGAIKASDADVALSVTGYAGEGDEPGLVHFGCLRRGGEPKHREEHFGDIGRGPIRLECVRVACEMMREAIG